MTTRLHTHGLFIGILLATLLMGFALFRYTPLGFILIPFDQNPGFFYRPHFNAIVNQVNASGIKPGERREFYLNNLSDPKSLRPRKEDEYFDRGKGTGQVWAERMKNGTLKVVIETKDLGHAGEYGFAYSEVPLKLEPQGAGWFTVPVPCHLCWVKPNMQINAHWWRVEFNLD